MTIPSLAFHLAQVNVARARGEMSDPVMADFAAALPPSTRWRRGALASSGDSRLTTETPPRSDRTTTPGSSSTSRSGPTLSALRGYVFGSDHAAYLRRRREWFERFDKVYVALWWVPAGHRPPMREAVDRLAHLEAHGPTAHAFGFATPFGPDGQTA